MFFLKKNSCCTRNLFFVFTITLLCSFAYAGYDYRFESADNEVTMQVARNERAVDISLRFSFATKIGSVSVEKSNEAMNNFSRCSYLSFDGQQEVVIIKKRDSYPFSSVSDAYYRLRINFLDGSERVYPPVRLPAVTE
jgi:hypothetical protein